MTHAEPLPLSAFAVLSAMPTPWTEQGLLRILDQLGQSHGFAYAALSTLSASDDGASEMRIALSNWPEPFLNDHERHGLGRYSPILRALKADSAPFCWDMESLFGYDPAADDDDEMIRLLVSAEHVTGVFFPVHGPGGLYGAASFAGSHMALSDDMLAALHSVAFALFGILSACRLQENRSNNPLSQRERDCLRMAMLGKTSSEIGSALSLSEHTVSQHLASATRKLNAANRTHAVALAAQLGYLS